MSRDYIIGVEPPPSFSPPLPDFSVEPPVEVEVLLGDPPGSMPWTVPPMLLARSLTCSTTRLITLRTLGVAAAPTAAPAAAAAKVRLGDGRRAAFLAPLFFAPPFLALADFRADVAFELPEERFFDAFFEDLEDFFEPPFREAEAFFEEAFFEEAFFDDGRRLLEAFFDDFLELFLDALFFDEAFFEVFFEVFFEAFLDAFFEDFREERFFDAAMFCLLL